MSDLPDPLANALQSSFYSTYLADEKRLLYFKAMVRDPEASLNRGFCVRQKVLLRVTADEKYVEANGNISRTCDNCLKKQHMCVRLVKVNNELKLALFPLPVQHRSGRKETDMAYLSCPEDEGRIEAMV